MFINYINKIYFMNLLIFFLKNSKIYKTKKLIKYIFVLINMKVKKYILSASKLKSLHTCNLIAC